MSPPLASVLDGRRRRRLPQPDALLGWPARFSSKHTTNGRPAIAVTSPGTMALLTTA